MLTSAVASLWLPAWAAVGAGARRRRFNWTFVPPRHQFSVDLDQHVLLLASMLLGQRHRRGVDQPAAPRAARSHAEREERLRGWGDTLRDASDPPAYASALHDVLVAAAGVPVAVIVLPDLAAKPEDEAAVLHSGECAADQRAGLALCVRTGQAMGPGNRPPRGAARSLPAVARARGHARRGGVARPGRASARWRAAGARPGAMRHDGAVALPRATSSARAELAREQGVRNALLAAISHDYRTLLATIMGAGLGARGAGRAPGPRAAGALAAGIVEEVQRLSRLTDNTLQPAARLDAPGVEPRRDWERRGDRRQRLAPRAPAGGRYSRARAP
ncbi:MAG: hypothetical protein U1F25_13485 [Rubrivivax sp.]